MGSRLRNIGLHAFMVVLLVLILIPLIPLIPLAFLWYEISGQGRRVRRIRSRLVDERPPLPDSEFLQVVGADEAVASLWLGVRSCLAEYWSVPPEAIHPADPMSELWWMHSDWPDILDMIFRLERTFGFKIPRGALDSAWGEPIKGDQEFGEFGELTVRALRQIREKTEEPF